MSSSHSYMFHNSDRIKSYNTDQTQNTIHNTRFANHMLADYFSQNTTNQHVQFAVNQPAMTFNGVSHGIGAAPAVVQDESKLLIKTEQTNPAERLQLFTRPFVTVPYLGRGSANPDLESELFFGEPVHEKKSVSTVMDKSFSPYMLQPLDGEMEERVQNAALNVEESAMEGWIRGGAASREMSTEEFKNQSHKLL